MQKTYLIVNKQVKFLTAFSSNQMNRTKLALAMSWCGNVLNSIYRHFYKCLYKGLCHKLSTNNSNDFFLKDNKKAFILGLNVPKVTAYS